MHKSLKKDGTQLPLHYIFLPSHWIQNTIVLKFFVSIRIAPYRYFKIVERYKETFCRLFLDPELQDVLQNEFVGFVCYNVKNSWSSLWQVQEGWSQLVVLPWPTISTPITSCDKNFITNKFYKKYINIWSFIYNNFYYYFCNS